MKIDRPNAEIRPMPGCKCCRKCKLVKELDAYSPNRRCPDGRQYVCKSCRAKDERARRDKDPAGNLLRRREYYQKIKAGICAKNRKRYREDEEYRRSVRRYAKEYRRANPSIQLLFKAHARLRKARKRAAVVYGAKEILAWERKWRSNRTAKCYWCGGRFRTTECHTDHVIALIKGGVHTLENLAISCGRCNLSKGGKSLTEWNDNLTQPVLL